MGFTMLCRIHVTSQEYKTEPSEHERGLVGSDRYLRGWDKIPNDNY